MEIAEYEKMYKFEEKYWWWVGKREIVKRILDRLILNSTKEIETDVKELPNIVNRFLASILRIEDHIISYGVNLPFGISILCVCKKSEKNEVK